MDVFYILAYYFMNFRKQLTRKKTHPENAHSFHFIQYMCAQYDDEHRMVYYAWQTDSKITEKSLMRTFSLCYSIYLIFDASSSIATVDKITLEKRKTKKWKAFYQCMMKSIH
jgi:predicted transcriptional regulator YdeE